MWHTDVVSSDSGNKLQPFLTEYPEASLSLKSTGKSPSNVSEMNLSLFMSWV